MQGRKKGIPQKQTPKSEFQKLKCSYFGYVLLRNLNLNMSNYISEFPCNLEVKTGHAGGSKSYSMTL